MANRLQKLTKSRYVAGSPGVPQDPGQPFLPAHWVSESVRECAYGPDEDAMLAAGWTHVFIPPQPNRTGYFIWRPPTNLGSNSAANIPYRNICKTVVKQRWVAAQPYRAPTPAIPPIPSQTIIDKQLGWNARAQSKEAFPAYGQVVFTVPNSVIGVIAGLNDAPKTSGYMDIRFAFYLSHGIARVMESGVEKHYVGPCTEGASFAIRRLRGQIYYLIDGSIVYSSPNTDVPLFLDAALYSGGDYVDEPAVEAWVGGDGVLSAFQFIGGEGAAASGAHVTLSAFIGSGRVGSRSSGVMSALIGIGAFGAYSESASVLPAFTGSGEGGMLGPSLAISDGVMSLLTGSAFGLTGENGGGNGVMTAIDGLSSEGPYGASSGKLAAIVGAASAPEGNDNASFMNFSVAQDFFTAPVELYVLMNSAGSVTTVFAADTILVAQANSTASAATDWALQALLNAVMRSTATGASIAPMSDEQQAVWVVNLENQGSTRYENYPFNSFAKIGNSYYGAAADGLYRLDGATDAGSPVQAMLSLGKQTFGDHEKKSVPNCYIGMSSGGKMYLKVISEGQEYIYAARASDAHMKQQRFDLGRGFRSNYLEFELYNKDGDDFELDTVEFLVATLSRRI